MRMTVATTSIGQLLVAGQAAASSSSAVTRVGDRVRASSAESSEISGVTILVLLIGTAVIVVAVVVGTDDGGEIG